MEDEIIISGDLISIWNNSDKKEEKIKEDKKIQDNNKEKNN